MKIPVAKPFLGPEEIDAAGGVIASGWVTQGPKTREFEEAFAQFTGAKYACAVSSCTTALHLALLAAGVKPGDAVITVSHSFIATANVVRYCLAEPVFVDVDPATFGMSPEALRSLIHDACYEAEGRLYFRDIDRLATGQSPLCHVVSRDQLFGRIAAILVVHQVGMPCALGEILEIAGRYKIPVIEDAACAAGSEISFDQGRTVERIGRPHGDIACFSFHPRKVMTTGEGGMITTNNADHDARFRLLRQHAMSVNDLQRHNASTVIFENYPELGYNYRMTDIQAAIGLVQLGKLPGMVDARAALARRYHAALSSVDWLVLPQETSGAKSNWQSYCAVLKENAPVSRAELMQRLLTQGVATRAGIMNAHEQPCFFAQGWQLPVSERICRNGLILPLFCGMTEEDVQYVTELIKNG